MNDHTSIRWLAWNPTTDTLVAFATAIVWIGAYYLLTHLDAPPFSTAYYFAALLAAVLFPLWWVCLHRGRSLSEIGITARRGKESLLIGLVVGAPFLWLVAAQYGATYGNALVPHIVANALYLWEPFFVFCWLQLQYRSAFGILPGIVLAGLSFGAYHLGTYPLPQLGVLVVYGIVFAAIFCLTENLLSLWPVAWAASSAKGTLAGGMLFTWHDAGLSAIILAIQLVVIAWLWRQERDRAAGEGTSRG